jgi:hypothetical protein
VTEELVGAAGVSRATKFFVFEDLDNYTTLRRVIRQRKRKIRQGDATNVEQVEREDAPTSVSSQHHLKPVYLLKPKHIAFLVLQLLEMANHLYNHGIVHRKLCPGNIFVRSTAAAARRDDPDASNESSAGGGGRGARRSTKRASATVTARAHRRSRETEAGSGDPEGILDIVPVDGVEPVEDEDGNVQSSTPAADKSRRDSDEDDDDDDVELMDVDSSSDGADSDQQEIYRLRVGNFSESIQVMKLPYSSRLISLGASPSSIYLAPEVSSVRRCHPASARLQS